MELTKLDQYAELENLQTNQNAIKNMQHNGTQESQSLRSINPAITCWSTRMQTATQNKKIANSAEKIKFYMVELMM